MAAPGVLVPLLCVSLVPSVYGRDRTNLPRVPTAPVSPRSSSLRSPRSRARPSTSTFPRSASLDYMAATKPSPKRLLLAPHRNNPKTNRKPKPPSPRRHNRPRRSKHQVPRPRRARALAVCPRSATFFNWRDPRYPGSVVNLTCSLVLFVSEAFCGGDL